MTLAVYLQTKLTQAVRDSRGQDLVEYALMAGFVAVTVATLMPDVADGISTIFSSIVFTLANGKIPASQG